MPVTKTQRAFQICIAAITWFAVILQFYLQIVNRTTEVGEAIIRFFSYFTILTNILVAVCFTSLLLQKKKEGFFHKPGVLTAVTVYIFIVGMVYNLVLRSQWNPQGWQLVADNLLHTVTPLLALVYWFIYASTGNIGLQQLSTWLLYPLFYLVYVLIRGSFSNFYPYFFIDVSKLGYAKAFINALYVTGCFLLVSLLLTWLGNRKKV
ncbi:Pr6Pr family membrane protein [Lacibacter cauensis]|nr:Pr6Pr family membrane protein [Lacibacter cauensis]